MFFKALCTSPSNQISQILAFRSSVYDWVYMYVYTDDYNAAGLHSSLPPFSLSG
jgi:hypothetical protein